MRRSICYCEPSVAKAGEVNTWKFIYTSSTALPKGTRLKFDLLSNGRDIDWQLPQTSPKKNSNVIFAELDNGKTLAAQEVENPTSFAPQYEFILPAALQAGNHFKIIIGSPDQSKSKTHGNMAQIVAQRRRLFNLYISTTGKPSGYGEPEVFSMDIRGGDLSVIKILAPSFVVKNKRFDITLRFEDQFGNLTNAAPEETMIDLTYEHLRENLKWSLFVPETGFINLPNLYFNDLGIYTIQLRNLLTKEVFRSSPIKCFPDAQNQLFWGLFHGESERIDSTENIENCLRHIRDEKALQFFASSCFESQEETPPEIWKLISQHLTEFNEEDRFATFPGFQWVGDRIEEGVRQIVYAKDQKQIMRKKDPKYSSLQKIYKGAAPKELISIPCFTMAEGFEFDFKQFDPQFERVVEIYNSWGSSECSAKEGNPWPIKKKGTGGVKESDKGSIQKALKANCRFGFVAGGLDDRGIYSELFESDQDQYAPGLTAVIATGHNRQAIIEALYQRSCYATTGERIIVGLYIAGLPMGSEISAGDKQGLMINRHISGYVAGTTDLVKVEIIRNGEVFKVFKPKGYSLEFTFDDMSPLNKVVLNGGQGKPPFVYYYLRVTQADGHMAWSSPIWIDLLPPNPAKAEARRAAAKQVKKVPAFDEGLDEELAEEDEDDYSYDGSSIDDEDDEG